MFLDSSEVVRKVNGLTEKETELACAFIQGAVYAWLGANPDKSFAVRDLFGGINAYVWQNTPLDPLWRRLEKAGKSPEDAFEQAAKDAGWLLKSVLKKDERIFLIEREEISNRYSWKQDKQ